VIFIRILFTKRINFKQKSWCSWELTVEKKLLKEHYLVIFILIMKLFKNNKKIWRKQSMLKDQKHSAKLTKLKSNPQIYLIQMEVKWNPDKILYRNFSNKMKYKTLRSIKWNHNSQVSNFFNITWVRPLQTSLIELLGQLKNI
jgi:hypothetical protein